MNTKSRTKGIGIRKVLCALVSGIVSLFSEDFIQLVLVAIVIAHPIVWWAMDNWLAFRAALVNPVESLHDE